MRLVTRSRPLSTHARAFIYAETNVYLSLIAVVQEPYHTAEYHLHMHAYICTGNIKLLSPGIYLNDENFLLVFRILFHFECRMHFPICAMCVCALRMARHACIHLCLVF